MSGRRKKPMFPGFEQCLAMLRKSDAMTQEEGYHALLPRVSQYADRLIAILATDDDPRLQSWLLELLGEARTPAALPTFAHYLGSGREDLRHWARSGIAKLAKTSEGRCVLWNIHLRAEAAPEDLAPDEVGRLRECIAEVLGAAQRLT